MAAARWNGQVGDSPGSDPWAFLGDLLVAVRTPRSLDFVTVEVAPAAAVGADLTSPAGVRVLPAPAPCVTPSWQGELRPGDTVGFDAAGESWRLTLSQLAKSPRGLPWIVCDFSLERD